MLRVNPHLSHVEPNCTYDDSPFTPPEVEGSQTAPLQNLSKLEERVEELEKLLASKKQPSSGSPDYPTPTWNMGVGDSGHDTLFTPAFDIYGTSAFTPDPLQLPIITEQWPLSLPPKPLTFHLLDLFFTCYPNARRIIHRPTFQMQLLEHPSSPRFPFLPLLHSICTAAAMHSHLVTTAPATTRRGSALDDVFQEKMRMQQNRQLAFDERHYLIAKYGCMAAAREGKDLIGVIQGKRLHWLLCKEPHVTFEFKACIINSWWTFGCARWFDLWQCNSLAMRLCIALGLNLPDSLQKPLPSKTRERLLIGAPPSHTDVELRRNIFWLSYCLERFHLAPDQWAVDISDEDIPQTLPGSLEAFEAGYDDGQERQSIFSADLFTSHYSNQDDFGMYVKCAIMMSRIHTTQYRRLAKLETAEEVRCSPELRIIETMVSSMRSSVLKMKLNPLDQSSTSAISNIYLAHMVPLWAVIKIHIDLANWSDPSCESATKCLAAAKSITQYIVALGTTSWDFSRLDKSAGLCWTAAGRVLVFSLKHAPENLEPMLRAEVRLVRNNFLIGGDRVILYLRQRCWFDLEAAEYLGEKEAAKLFAEDEY